MKQAIEKYIETEEQKEALKQETLARWQEVNKGQTVPHATVKQWLQSWGSNHEKDKPE